MSGFSRDVKIRQLQETTPVPGHGDPNGVVTASPGRLYVDLDGGAGVTLYVKESGVDTNVGWVAK